MYHAVYIILIYFARFRTEICLVNHFNASNSDCNSTIRCSIISIELG